MGGDSILIIRWEYGGQGFNTELVLEGCGEFMPLLGRNGSSGKYVLIALRMSVIDREKESIDGRLIGRVGGEIHKCRGSTLNCYWRGVGQVYHSLSVLDGIVGKGMSVNRFWMGGQTRWGSQHWLSGGGLRGGDCTFTVRWKCGVPLLLNGKKGHQCEWMLDGLTGGITLRMGFVGWGFHYDKVVEIEGGFIHLRIDAGRA
ncbi:hypothetical protein T03_15566 [Trichinella britovi]|uniref:Uncharacterized protein n=1 Tax=Trichinella britovi TaxID=45882 RepID=A0A0V1C5N0_TRIBR|nr:hypothetical protein T03_15566 [Trichinella britovi]